MDGCARGLSAIATAADVGVLLSVIRASVGATTVYVGPRRADPHRGAVHAHVCP